MYGKALKNQTRQSKSPQLIVSCTLAITVLLTAGGCGLSRLWQPGPAGTVKRFVYYVQDYEIQKAMSLLSRSIHSMLPEAKVRAFLENQANDIKTNGGIKSFEINSEDVRGDIARVQATLTYGNGTRKADKSKLIREDDVWKIDFEK